MLTSAMLGQFFLLLTLLGFMHSFLGCSALQILYELLEDYKVRLLCFWVMIELLTPDT